MRITDKMIESQVINGLKKSSQKLAKTHNRIATTKNITRSSDDPIGSAKIMGQYKDLYKVSQTIKNSENSEALLSYTDSIVEKACDILYDARTSATVMASDTVGKDARKTVANEIGLMIEQMQQLANSRFAGKYIFSGQQVLEAPYSKDVALDKVRYTGDNVNTYFTGSLDSTASVGIQYEKQITAFDSSGNSHTIKLTFEKTAYNTWDWTSDQGTATGTNLTFGANGSLTSGANGTITFSGWGSGGSDLDVNIDFSKIKQLAGASSTKLYAPINNGDIEYIGDQREIKHRIELGDQTMTVNFPGTSVFGQGTVDGGIFKTLKDLKTALESNNTSDINKTLSLFDDEIDRIGTVRGEIGIKVIRIQSNISELQSLQLSLKDGISKIEDVDMAEEAGQFIIDQETYQSALQATATVLKLPKLSDYLS
jgi:flagellar hook-associated protein 3 FlgL